VHPVNRNKSTFEQRVDWLVVHSDVWLSWYVAIVSGKIHFRQERKYLIMRMKVDDLFAQSTYWLDTQLDDELVMAFRILRERQGLCGKG
jgi:hypothetical protein